MTTDLAMALAIGVLAAVGVYLMLSKNLIRVTIGFLLIGHGTNLLLLSTGAWGTPPIIGEPGNGPLGTDAPSGHADVADPLPQAFVLTSIVITVAVACFLLAVVYRQYLLTRATDLPDDPDDELVGTAPGGDE